ncbi:MAG: AmmeMemoRadiSam system protein A [Coriobacteriales bacterium]|jgi:AmmeMemoRadiSam system protein A|nr:AmmeMemoRadiSam system protein A [Coriobacteriales bacterium]
MGVLAAFAVPHPPLLIPGVGDANKQSVHKTQTAFEEVAARSAALKPETLVIFSPHAALYADCFALSSGFDAQGDFGSFGAPGAAYCARYDEEFIASLAALLAKRGIPCASQGAAPGANDTTLDHGTMVPLHFFGAAAGDEGGAGGDVKIVRIGLSALSYELHRQLGRAVAEVAETLGRSVVVVASGDLSHKLSKSGPYGFAPEGPILDEQICAALAQGSVADLMAIDERLADSGAECGLRSFIMMGGAIEQLDYSAELLSYEGPFGVGYAVASYVVAPEGLSLSASTGVNTEAELAGYAEAELASSERTFKEASLPARLARQALQCFFEEGGRRPDLDTPTIKGFLEHCQHNPRTEVEYNELKGRRAGVFVSLHERGELRGCIGTIAPTRESVLAEIIQNAVSAAREDPRFLPLRAEELANLTVKVDVLGQAQPVADRMDLDAQRYGVIVSLGYRRGLLLPALDGVDTPEEQITIALSKAGIRKSESYKLERFEVVRYI